MNKFLKMVNGAVIAIAGIGIAHADNSWTGYYVGANAGYVFNNADLKAEQLGFTNPGDFYDASKNFSTFSSGGQLGYVYQFPNAFVAGIEADVTFNTNQKETFSFYNEFSADVYDRFIFRNQLQTSIKGRFGYAVECNTLLPYLTAGVSFADVGLKYENEGGDYYSTHHIQAGWLIGAGMEWVFWRHWSLRAEYNYIDYGNIIKLKIPSVYMLEDPNGNARVNLKSNNAALAVNYWF